MTKIISDEEIHQAYFNNRGKWDREARRAIAEAQRDRSDEEWIEMLERHHPTKETRSDGVSFVIITIQWEDWQALKQKV